MLGSLGVSGRTIIQISGNKLNMGMVESRGAPVFPKFSERSFGTFLRIPKGPNQLRELLVYRGRLEDSPLSTLVLLSEDEKYFFLPFDSP
jgi:hypothetical protein